jgi:hypothetical protein
MVIGSDTAHQYLAYNVILSNAERRISSMSILSAYSDVIGDVVGP